MRETLIGCLSYRPHQGTQPATRGPNPHPGVGPDWELNQQLFALQDDAQPTKLSHTGQGGEAV